MIGKLTAERDGPHVRFTMEYPPRPDDLHPDEEWYDAAWAVERFEGLKEKHDAQGNPVLDDNGNPVMVEDWRHIHTGTRKFVRHTSDHHMHHPTTPNPPHAGPHNTYRALVYRVFEKPPSGVTMLETHGQHTPPVTI